MWDTGYIAQPYYFACATGENAFVITSDGAEWLIQSMSDSLNIIKLNDIAQDSIYVITGNTSDRVITVKTKAGTENIRVLRMRFVPRYS